MVIPILLFAVALAVRVLLGSLFTEPAYPDAYYYANLARGIAAGDGFSIDYIWNFIEVGGRLPDTGTLPIASNAHWMPLAALVQVPFLWLLGPTPMAAALPFWLAAAAVAPLTWAIGRDAGMPDWQAAAGGLLVAVPAGLSPFLGQPDNFALYMLLGALALWLCARGARGHQGAFVLGGVVVGLAFLSRNDGVLLAVPYLLVFAWDRLRRVGGPRLGWAAAIACAIGFSVIAAPWLLRQLEVFGSISPSSAGGRILFITEYGELYSVTTETTLDAFLAQGLPALIESRLLGLWNAAFIFSVSALIVILLPFLAWGTWLRRRSPDYLPWLIYAVALFAFSALVSAVHVRYGTFVHSAVALVPHAYLLSLVGLAAAVRWVGARRPTWDVPRATRNFSYLLVGVIAAVSMVSASSTLRAWTEERDSRGEVLAALAAQGRPGDVVMSSDAGAYRYHGGWSGIVTPDDPLPVVEQALRLYGVRWLALEADHITPGLAPILAGDVRPAWLSAPIVTTQPTPSAAEPTILESADPPLPRAALFAVCLAPDDRRCDA